MKGDSSVGVIVPIVEGKGKESFRIEHFPKSAKVRKEITC